MNGSYRVLAGFPLGKLQCRAERWERVGEVHPLRAFDGTLVKRQKTQNAAAEGLQQDPGSSCTVIESTQVNGKASRKPGLNSIKKLSCRGEKQK